MSNSATVQFFAVQLNAYGRERRQSRPGQLGFMTAILEYARGPTADLGTVDLFEIGQ